MLDMREMERVEAPVGEPVEIEVGYSEAAMHMRIAGKTLPVMVDGYGMAVVKLGGMWTPRILASEAGLYRDETGWYGYRRNQ